VLSFATNSSLPLIFAVDNSCSCICAHSGAMRCDGFTVTKSPTNHPAWVFIGCSEPNSDNLTVESSDLVHFHVSQAHLQSISLNNFDAKLPIPVTNEAFGRYGASYTSPILHSPYSSTALNLSLDAMYSRDTQLAEPIPSLSELSSAIAALETFGIPLQTYVTRSSLIFASFSAHCQLPSGALEVYAIASSHRPVLHHLAAHASQFLLSLDLFSITDEAASHIDPIYLQKLFVLHSDRVQEFKRLMSVHPPPHSLNCPTKCAEVEGEGLAKSWALACAFLTWCATPNLNSTTIRNVLPSVVDRLTCKVCKTSLTCRFDELCDAWALVKKTI